MIGTAYDVFAGALDTKRPDYASIALTATELSRYLFDQSAVVLPNASYDMIAGIPTSSTGG